MPTATSISESEYHALINGIINDCAPRVFAVVREDADLADGEIVAWGMAFDDWAEAVTVPGRMRIRVNTMEGVVQRFSREKDVTARVMWVRSAA